MDAAQHHHAADVFAKRAEDCFSDAFRPKYWWWQRRRLRHKANTLALLALAHRNLTATDRLIADIKKPPAAGASAAEGQTSSPLKGTES